MNAMSDEPPASLTPEELEQLYYDAAREGHEALLAEFLRQGCDPNRPDSRGFPPIILAAYNGQAANDMGRTPLMFAVMFGRKAMVELLLEAGANPALADMEGHTALDLATGQSDPAIYERLTRA